MIRTLRNTAKATKAFVLETTTTNPAAQPSPVVYVHEHCAKCYVAAPPKGRQTGWHYTPKGLLCPKDGGR